VAKQPERSTSLKSVHTTPMRFGKPQRRTCVGQLDYAVIVTLISMTELQYICVNKGHSTYVETEGELHIRVGCKECGEIIKHTRVVKDLPDSLQ